MMMMDIVGQTGEPKYVLGQYAKVKLSKDDGSCGRCGGSYVSSSLHSCSGCFSQLRGFLASVACGDDLAICRPG